MILTCPACGTQYVVKDGAIPPGGRKVRCASCRHSWHQEPDTQDTLELPAASAIPPADTAEEPLESADHDFEEEPAHSDDAPSEDSGFASERAVEDADYEPIDEAEAPPSEPLIERPLAPEAMQESESAAYPPPQDEWVEPAHAATVAPPIDEDEFSPFARRGAVEEKPARPLLRLLLIVLVVAALAAAFWFLAPPQWKARLGLAGVAETPLQLMMTHSDRQRLASGNELLAVSGRVINPTGERQTVPPITAELRNSNGQVVHRWSIAPPARTLEPGASAPFNSAEVNVPAGGQELTVTLGAPRA